MQGEASARLGFTDYLRVELAWEKARGGVDWGEGTGPALGTLVLPEEPILAVGIARTLRQPTTVD